MAHPKHRTSKAKTRSRRAHHALKPGRLVECTNCGELHQPHHVCPACGFYRGAKRVTVEE